jgi:flagellar M-ring protein FliF
MSIVDNIKALSRPRQVVLAGAVLATLLGIGLMVRSATQEPMSVLYSGLDLSAIGEVTEALERDGVRYTLEGDTIRVPRSARDQARIGLAREGLPQQGVQGYELLDAVNGFSVTSEMYNASYWRAKEGELTRTILAIPGVNEARVHIGAELGRGFSARKDIKSASVTVSARSPLGKEMAESIQYLVALAIAGLKPSDVAVIDTSRGVIAGPGIMDAAMASTRPDEAASAIEAKLLRLFEARVGNGHVRVSANVEVSRDREVRSSVTIDPESRVLRSRNARDLAESSTGSPGAITVASNLPVTAGPDGGGSSASVQETTENVTYDYSQTRVDVETAPGRIERVSVAVVIDEAALGIDLSTPEAPATLERIRTGLQDLAYSAGGLVAERGDKVSIEIMPFRVPEADDLVAAPGPLARFIELHLWSAVQLGVLSLVVVVLGLGVIRPLVQRRPEPAVEPDALPASIEAEAALLAIPAPDPVEQLRAFTRERKDETAIVLEDWLSQPRSGDANGT